MDDCLFCKIVNNEIKCWKVFENQHVLAFLDLDPVNEYHTLVIPKKHYQDIFDVPEEILQEVILAVKQICMLYQEKLGISNIQLFNNSGQEAQQSIFHLHFHIIPRSYADGHNVYLEKHPELVSKFDKLLEQLQ
ncbi:MAG: HIT family protein [Anaerolineaceae bacterium]